MKNSSPNKKRKVKVTPLGIILIGSAIPLPLLSYFFLGVHRYFLNLRGTLGLSDTFWVFIGGMICCLIIAVPIIAIAQKFCIKKEDNE